MRKNNISLLVPWLRVLSMTFQAANLVGVASGCDCLHSSALRADAIKGNMVVVTAGGNLKVHKCYCCRWINSDISHSSA